MIKPLPSDEARWRAEWLASPDLQREFATFGGCSGINSYVAFRANEHATKNIAMPTDETRARDAEVKREYLNALRVGRGLEPLPEPSLSRVADGDLTPAWLAERLGVPTRALVTFRGEQALARFGIEHAPPSPYRRRTYPAAATAAVLRDQRKVAALREELVQRLQHV